VLPYEQNVEVRYNGNDAPVLPTWQHQVSGLVSQCVPAGHHSFQCGVLHFMGLSVILKVGMQFGVFLSSFQAWVLLFLQLISSFQASQEP
jgi:hypothetical protein